MVQNHEKETAMQTFGDRGSQGGVGNYRGDDLSVPQTEDHCS